MKKPKCVEDEFNLMVNYQIAIESKSIITENSDKDKHRYSLSSILEPYPDYNEYRNGNEFDEGEVIHSTSSLSELINIQEERRYTMAM